MQQRLTIVTLGVRNLETSTSFYEKHFGWKKTRSSNDDITFFELNGILLSLYNRDKLAEDASVDPDGTGFNGITLSYNTRSEKEVDEIIQGFADANVRIVKQPEKVFWGGYSSYISDPDGHLWEIAFNPFLPMDDDGNIPLKNRQKETHSI